MKLAISTYSLSRWQREKKKSLLQTIDWIADADVQGIEFAGLETDRKGGAIRHAKAVRKKCEKRGLEVAGYCVPIELYGSSIYHRRITEQLKEHIDVAAELGVKSMRHDVTAGPKNRGEKVSFNNVLNNVAPLIRRIAEYAQGKGIVTSLENHGFYMQKATRVKKLIKKVNHSNFRVTLDTGNFLCVNDDPVESVRSLAPYAVMVHLKDFHVKPKNQMPPDGWFATPSTIALRGAILGHGDIDVPAQLRILKKVGYDGYLSLEFEGVEEPTFAVKSGLKYLRAELKKIRRLHG